VRGAASNPSHLTTTNGPPNGLHSVELYDGGDIDTTVNNYFYFGDGNEEKNDLNVEFEGLYNCGDEISN
jgi:hypothetical protein